MKIPYQAEGRNQISDRSNKASLSFEGNRIRVAIMKVECQLTRYWEWQCDKKKHVSDLSNDASVSQQQPYQSRCGQTEASTYALLRMK